VISRLRLVFFICIIYHSIVLIEDYLLIRDFVLQTNLARYGRVRVFRILKISTRVFSLSFVQLVLRLVWLGSPDLGLSNNGRAKFVALGLRGRQVDEGTRFGLL
jgi:hypothetical protein